MCVLSSVSRSGSTARRLRKRIRPGKRRSRRPFYAGTRPRDSSRDGDLWGLICCDLDRIAGMLVASVITRWKLSPKQIEAIELVDADRQLDIRSKRNGQVTICWRPHPRQIFGAVIRVIGKDERTRPEMTLHKTQNFGIESFGAVE